LNGINYSIVWTKISIVVLKWALWDDGEDKHPNSDFQLSPWSEKFVLVSAHHRCEISRDPPLPSSPIFCDWTTALFVVILAMLVPSPSMSSNRKTKFPGGPDNDLTEGSLREFKRGGQPLWEDQPHDS